MKDPHIRGPILLVVVSTLPSFNRCGCFSSLRIVSTTAFESLAGGVEALLSGVVILVILLVVWVLPHRFWFTRAMNLSEF
jgi:hypothetical protein